jgi:ribose transport system substrate-binding protein
MRSIRSAGRLIAFETIEQVRKGEQVPVKKLITDRFFDRTNAAQFVADAY